MKKDLISIQDISRQEIEEIFELAHYLEKGVCEKGTIEGESQWWISQCYGKTLAKLFYEPSTRTRESFELAMQNFRGKIIGFNNPEVSSVDKGESISDTARIYDGFVKKGGGGLIIIRHPQAGVPEAMAQYTDAPVVNAGDGINEHPTQTLVDLYTIQQKLGHINGLHIGIVGDIKNGRTVHSLMLGLNKFKDIEFHIWAPPVSIKQVGGDADLRAEHDFLDSVKYENYENEVLFSRCDFALIPFLKEIDVLYVTRIQKERFANPEDYEAVKGSYCINSEIMNRCKQNMLLMHPLPRVDEIAAEVDGDPRAIYFEQFANGVPVRMALIVALLKKAYEDKHGRHLTDDRNRLFWREDKRKCTTKIKERLFK